MHHLNIKTQKNLRQHLRKNLTHPENVLWQALRRKQLGVKFRRQHGMDRYIVDFYCAECKLVIEIDGESHFSNDAQEYDASRDAQITSFGFKVIRFLNTDVINNLPGVLAEISNIISETKDVEKTTPP